MVLPNGPEMIVAFLALACGTALTLLGLGFVQAATAQALVEIDQGRPIGPVRAYLLAVDSIRPLLGALLVAATVVSLLVSSIYLIPIAVWLAGRWALIAPSIELEGLGALAGQEQRAEFREILAGDMLALRVILLDGAEGGRRSRR